MCQYLLRDVLQRGAFDLGICLVNEKEITRLNEEFLAHKGSTDVITFDYAESGSTGAMRGEIFVCVDEAVRQAKRFHATWQSELVRYIVHGVLHLLGYEDVRLDDRRKMKREEDRLLRQVADAFSLASLAKTCGKGF